MSAFMCDDATLKAIACEASVSFGVYGNARVRQEEAVRYLGVLHAQNAASLVALYGARQGAEMGSPLPRIGSADERAWEGYSPLSVLRAIMTYEYQACETSDYFTSEAAEIVATARKNAIRRLPGYDDAPRIGR